MAYKKSISALYKRYPRLLPKNCIECDSGWVEIIDHMCGAIEVYADNEMIHEKHYPEFVSIKEKFGILQIEIKNRDNIIDLVVKSCEKISWHTCEVCGEPGELFCSSKYRDWSNYKTLCLEHAIELYYYQIWKEPT